jgi:cobalt/nickel transport system permease protein
MIAIHPAATHGHRSGYFGTIDPRARLVAAVAFSVLVVMTSRMAPLGLALSAAAVGVALSGCPLALVAKRLLPLNLLMALLVVVLPLTTPGSIVWQLGPMHFSQEGLRLAVTIAVKGNAVLMAIIVLLGTMDATTLGHALHHLHVPEKLAHLLLFTVRYLDVLHREYLRLRAAMKVRGFRPRMDRHTCRSFGSLVGMLLVRSFDRADRIAAAMKCRGFRGRFYLLDHFAFARRDGVFCAVCLALLLALSWMEWT